MIASLEHGNKVSWERKKTNSATSELSSRGLGWEMLGMINDYMEDLLPTQ